MIALAPKYIVKAMNKIRINTPRPNSENMKKLEDRIVFILDSSFSLYSLTYLIMDLPKPKSIAIPKPHIEDIKIQ